MKKYLIIVGDAGKDVSRGLCEELEHVGFRVEAGAWGAPILSINTWEPGCVSFSSDVGSISDFYLKKYSDIQLLFPHNIKGGCHRLMGANSKMEELTLEEVCKELGREVKIVK